MLLIYLIRYFINLWTVKNYLAWNPNLDGTVTFISLPQAQMVTFLYYQICWILIFFLLFPHPQNLSSTFHPQLMIFWICHQIWFRARALFFPELQSSREGSWIIGSNRGPMLFQAHALIHAMTEKPSLGFLEILWITNTKWRFFLLECLMFWH